MALVLPLAFTVCVWLRQFAVVVHWFLERSCKSKPLSHVLHVISTWKLQHTCIYHYNAWLMQFKMQQRRRMPGSVKKAWAYFKRSMTVVPKRVSHCMEMPSNMGRARSALKLISPLEPDLYTPFLAGLTVACTAAHACPLQTLYLQKQSVHTGRMCAVIKHATDEHNYKYGRPSHSKQVVRPSIKQPADAKSACVHCEPQAWLLTADSITRTVAPMIQPSKGYAWHTWWRKWCLLLRLYAV